MRILLIDDDPGITENLALYLEDGFHTVETLNYLSSLDDLGGTLQDFRPEGVVLDFDMAPSGPEIYRWIRKWREDVPIVFYTQYAEKPSVRKEMLDLGIAEDGILTKRDAAWDVPDLVRNLRRNAYVETC
ncbi:MAG: response regulator [Acidobacteriota bacterium]